MQPKETMSSFPSSVERTVASSLLLLNTTPLSPSLSTPKFHSDYSGDALLERRSGSKRFREISVSYGSYKSSSSSLTEDDDDDDDDGDSSEKDIKSGSVSSSAVTRYDQMKLKVDSTFLCAFSSILILCLFRFVMCLCLEAQRKQTNMRDLKIHLTDSSNENHSVFFILIDSSLEFVSLRYVFVFIARKIRTKVAWTTSCSGDRKPNVGEAEKVLSPASVSGEASSCLSSSSSGISSERSLRYAKRCRGAIVSVAGINRETAAAAKRRGAGSPHLHRRGEAILKLLSCCGGSSEVKIRQMLGDSPDTSKALRMLLRVDAVKRSGSGGRYDPYVYMVHIFIVHQLI
ncbi:hypothetical protein GmHk_02G005033 [Glycine max]|nr:hypothetical protein GmHk_02G005033 [Glycine max]